MVASFRAARALGLGGPGRACGPMMGRFAHNTSWAVFVEKRRLVPSPPLSLLSLKKDGLPQFAEGHLCTSTSSKRRSFKDRGSPLTGKTV